LAKGDIARSLCKRNLVDKFYHSPDGSTRRECGTDAFGTLIFGESEVTGVSDGTIPILINCPLWSLRYL